MFFKDQGPNMVLSCICGGFIETAIIICVCFCGYITSLGFKNNGKTRFKKCNCCTHQE